MSPTMQPCGWTSVNSLLKSTIRNGRHRRHACMNRVPWNTLWSSPTIGVWLKGRQRATPQTATRKRSRSCHRNARQHGKSEGSRLHLPEQMFAQQAPRVRCTWTGIVGGAPNHQKWIRCALTRHQRMRNKRSCTWRKSLWQGIGVYFLYQKPHVSWFACRFR